MSGKTKNLIVLLESINFHKQICYKEIYIHTAVNRFDLIPCTIKQLSRLSPIGVGS